MPAYIHPNKKQYYSIGQTAQALGIAIDTLRRWEKDGKITATRSQGGMRLFSINEIKRLLPQTEALATALSVSEAANFLGVSPATLRRWDREGKLKPQRTLGNDRMYAKEQLEAFVNGVARKSAISSRRETIIDDTVPVEVTVVTESKNPVRLLKDKAYELSDSLILTVVDRSILQRYQSKIIVGIVITLFTAVIAYSHYTQRTAVAPVQPFSEKEFAQAAANLSQQASKKGYELVLYEKDTQVKTAELSTADTTSPIVLAAATSGTKKNPSLPYPPNTPYTPNYENAQPDSLFPSQAYEDVLYNVYSTTDSNSGTIISLAEPIAPAFHAGSSTIQHGQKQLFIKNTSVHRNTKIFLGGTTDTALTPVVLEKKPNEGFVVGLSRPATQPVTFDWLIVN